MDRRKREAWVHLSRAVLVVLMEHETDPEKRQVYADLANELPAIFGIGKSTGGDPPGGAPAAWQQWMELLKEKGIKF